jgi:hypothetical protein
MRIQVIIPIQNSIRNVDAVWAVVPPASAVQVSLRRCITCPSITVKKEWMKISMSRESGVRYLSFRISILAVKKLTQRATPRIP